MTSYSLIQGDCLEKMRDIPDGIVDMVFADLPYGVTANKWDTVIPFEPLWTELLRVGKKNAAFVFTATQPFATSLINSQTKLFRYDLIWQKSMVGGFMNAKKQPLREHECILCFYRNQPVYNPQRIKAEKQRHPTTRSKARNCLNGGPLRSDYVNIDDGLRHPRSILSVQSENSKHHPTQKPVALLEWLVKTYSNEGDLVLDPTMGSGTTGVACLNTKRHFIGIEKDATYFDTATRRLLKAEGDAT